MEHGRSTAASASLASIAAGPLFLFSYTFAALYLKLPAPIEIDLRIVPSFMLMLIPALIIGFTLAIIPTIFGTLAMSALARRNELARLPAAWVVVGGVCGALIATMVGRSQYGMDAETAFALISTSAICAVICRKWS